MDYYPRPLVWLLETSVSTHHYTFLSKKHVCSWFKLFTKEYSILRLHLSTLFLQSGIERYVELRLSAPLHGNQQTSLGAEQVVHATTDISTNVSTYVDARLTLSSSSYLCIESF